MSGDAQIVELHGGAAVRAKLKAKAVAADAARLAVTDSAPMRLADLYRQHRHQIDGVDTLARYAGDWWTWRDGVYLPITDEDLDADVRAFLDGVDVVNSKGDRNPLVVTSHRVSEVRAALIDRRLPRVANGATLPTALMGYVGPSPASCIVVDNGVLNLDALTLTPKTPQLFATTRSDASYDPSVTSPRWLAFLAQIFDGDAESIRLLRQWSGYLISGDTSRQKMMMLFGPPRSGKGTIAKVLTALLGRGSVANPTLASLSEEFGMSSLIGKTAAIVNDARLSGRIDLATVAERLLSSSGEDTQTINRKFKTAVEVRLRARFTIVSNELPALTDASGALASRFCILETRVGFFNKEDRMLEQALLAELPGVLNWALEGLRDLAESGSFVEPMRAASARADLEALGSPTLAFLAECAVIDAAASVGKAVLFDHWKTWCGEQGRHPGAQNMFSRNLRSAIPGFGSARGPATLLADRPWLYTGLRLRDRDDQ